MDPEGAAEALITMVSAPMDSALPQTLLHMYPYQDLRGILVTYITYRCATKSVVSVA